MYAAPVTLPPRGDELAGALLAELQALGLESREPSVNGAVFKALAAAPSKLIDGLVVRADGTNWDPGYGAGMYVYRAGAWYMLPAYVPTFTAPTLLNGWTNYGGGFAAAGYYRDPFSRVHLKGLITGGSAASGTVLFSLPAGYRPSERLIFSPRGVIAAVDDAARVDVLANGDVQIQTGQNPYVSFDGISFAAI